MEYSDADRQLQAILQGPERDAIFSWMLDEWIALQSRPRSGGPRENVSQWLESLEVVPRGTVEVMKSYFKWCEENGQEYADPRDIVEEFEHITGRNLAESFLI
ncbi:hypothetical protein [Brachybacterium saurashtrense]|uniref:Uncharacterized protein n=1 Tax=Brachybacterium saurashtrense TaxID=556288 RepID=A0A345YNJ2_9MICO|nr:hypothetical protein [Brachybacterium saurashtrense]AXK45494.1 hypothetical protein DWV08_07620 [Brachybacterium saurashtrense]RRR21134.1 hypothetical protein DXU92_15725 [Brachybacterium saurashtrense]